MENPIKMDDLGGKPTIFGNTHIFQVNLRLLFETYAKNPNAFDSKNPEASHGGALLHIKAQDLEGWRLEVMVQITTKVQWELYAFNNFINT